VSWQSLCFYLFFSETTLQIFGRNLFWYAAVFGTITAISRAAIANELLVLDPEGAISMVVQHTHYMPKRWRGKEITELVRIEFETLFQVLYLRCLFNTLTLLE
jgi:autophagy-related protein 9